jgi:hypothetical protein
VRFINLINFMIDRYLYSMDSLFNIRRHVWGDEVLNREDIEEMEKESQESVNKLLQSIEALGINKGERRLVSDRHNFSLVIDRSKKPYNRKYDKEYQISIIADNIKPPSYPPITDHYRTVHLATIGVDGKKDVHFNPECGDASVSVSLKDVIEVIEAFFAQEIQPREA